MKWWGRAPPNVRAATYSGRLHPARTLYDDTDSGHQLRAVSSRPRFTPDEWVKARPCCDFGAKQRVLILGYHQWWRLVTAGFLHGGITHILLNSWVLLIWARRWKKFTEPTA